MASAAARNHVPLGPNSPFMVDVWQTDDGMPQSTVTAVIQTHDGYLWIGTQKGVARFDGVRFVTFDQDNVPEMKNSRVVQLFEDRKGVLWIATEDGLLEYSNGRFKAHHPPNLGTANSYARSLCDDEDGGLNMVSCEWQLLRLKDGKFTVTSDSWGLLQPRARFAVVNPEGGLWVGTRLEVAQGRAGIFNAIWSTPEMGSSLTDALAVSRGGGCWIAGLGRIRRFAPGKEPVEYQPCAPMKQFVYNLFEDRRGQLWACTGGDGLFRFGTDGSCRQFTLADGLPTDFIRCITEDREGNLWVGTEAGGLCRLRPALFSLYARKDGLAADQVISVHAARGGGVWAGSSGKHLSLVKPEGIELIGPKQGLEDGNVWSVLEDSGGAVWAGTWDGLFRRDHEKFENLTVADGPIGGQILALYEDPDGGVWVGQQGKGAAAHILRGTAMAFVIPGADERHDVRVMTRDSEGRMWFGTAGDGLHSVRDGKATHFGKREGLPSEFVWSLLAETDGTLWIGTSKGGLSRLRGGNLANFNKANGLPSDTVCQIFPDESGHLWLGTHGGLYRVARRELERVANNPGASLEGLFLDASDGLPTPECNGGFQPSSARTSDGRWWVPTTKGLVAFDPARVKRNEIPPPVLVEEIRMDGVLLPPRTNDAQLIPPGRHRLEIRATALSLTAPARVRLRHRLESHDDKWIETGPQRALQYDYLPPGTYTLRVQACNNDGVWNEAGASLSILIQPLLWQTLWFRTLASLGTFTGIGGLA